MLNPIFRKESHLRVFGLTYQLKIAFDRPRGGKAFSPGGILDSSKVLNDIAGDIEPWVRLLGKERMNDIAATLQALATRLYSLPDKNEEFVKRSRKNWE